MSFVAQLAARRAHQRLAALRRPRPRPGALPGAMRGDASAHLRFLRRHRRRRPATSSSPSSRRSPTSPRTRAEAQLERLIAHIHATAPGVPVILDAKRGDMGTTAEQYAREVFERYRRRRGHALAAARLRLDRALPAPRGQGRDPALPHLEPRRRRPAGPAASPPARRLFERIARLAVGAWNRSGQIGLVVGATFPAEIARVRELAPNLPLLIPGIGAQGGDAAATVRAGWRGDAAHDDRRRSSSARRGPCSTPASRRRLRELRRRRAAEAARAELGRGAAR